MSEVDQKRLREISGNLIDIVSELTKDKDLSIAVNHLMDAQKYMNKWIIERARGPMSPDEEPKMNIEGEKD